MVWRDDEYPLMAEDLPKKSLKKARDSMREYGATVTDRVDSAIATAAAAKLKTSSTSGTRLKAARREMALKDIAPVIKDIPWSVERMANRKMDMIKSGVERSREAGENLRGAGWYFEHHRDVRDAAPETDMDVASAASAGLSPQSDPKKDEIPSLRSIHSALGSEQLELQVKPQFGPETYDRAGTTPGQRLTVADATTDQLATTNIGKSTVQNMRRAIGALRGEVPPDEVNRRGKAKSYQLSIRDAVPDTPEHLDYMGVAHHLVHGDPNQGMLMFDKAEPGDYPRESMMSPDRTTAEDTWMEGISTGQRMAYTGKQGRLRSPAKRIVDSDSPMDPSKLGLEKLGVAKKDIGTVGNIIANDVTHAIQNMATRRAAAKMGTISFNQFGENIAMPAVMAQEVSWVEAREQAGEG
tara:strand:- start:44 stop:1276 length:1233 start_codon:yes stop_codon:yes gene_type:complete